MMLDALPYLDDVRAAASFYFGVPAPVPVILAQITQESAWNPNARSRVGALGLLQFMPATAEWASVAGGFGIAAPLDPKWAIRAGTWFDRHLYDRVRYEAKGSTSAQCQRWGAALASYNGGLGWHNKRRARAADPDDFWYSVRLVNPGITPPNQRENQEYPYRILYNIQPKYAAFGPLVCH